MANKRKTLLPDWKCPQVKGKTFALTGTLQRSTKEESAALIRAGGGKLLPGVSAKLDVLVVGPTQSGAPSAALKAAQKLNATGAAIQILNELQFLELFMPTPAEVLAMLKGGPKEWNRLRRLPGGRGFTDLKVDLSGTDFRGLKIHGTAIYWDDVLDLSRLTLDKCDFRGASLRFVYLRTITGGRFEGADLRGSSVSDCDDCNFTNADLSEGSFASARRCILDGIRLTKGHFTNEISDCSAKGIDITGSRLNPADFSRSDFTGAKMRVETASYTVARDSTFKNADLREAELDESNFEQSDFTGADLTSARLDKSNFTGATLFQATLVRADLRQAILRKADLRKANFTGANLADADLRGAKIDGANFQGACLFDAKLGGLDLTRAANLTPAQQHGGTVRANTRKLARVGRASDRLETSLDLEAAGMKSTIVASVWHSSRGCYAGGTYTDYPQPNHSVGAQVEGQTLEKAMLNLAKRYFNGEVKLDSIQVDAKKCQLEKRQLIQLATAAWCEVFGLPVPSEEEAEEREEAKRNKAITLHEQALQELHGGPAGVKKWNDRPKEERAKAGPFRRQDFSGKDLRKAALASLDFQSTLFDNANLSEARFGGAKLQKASFRNANLLKGWLSGCKASDAVFDSAILKRCMLRAANFRRANFTHANLEHADFSFSDLSGADFTSASLTAVDWDRAIFDNQTRFPLASTFPHQCAGEEKVQIPGNPTTASGRKRVLRHADATQPARLSFTFQRVYNRWIAPGPSGGDRRGAFLVASGRSAARIRLAGYQDQRGGPVACL